MSSGKPTSQAAAYRQDVAIRLPCVSDGIDGGRPSGYNKGLKLAALSRRLDKQEIVLCRRMSELA